MSKLKKILDGIKHRKLLQELSKGYTFELAEDYTKQSIFDKHSDTDGSLTVIGIANRDDQTFPFKDTQVQIPSEAIANAMPNYMTYGNIREQHDATKAVGTCTEWWQEEGKTYISAVVVDREAIRKVKSGVLKALSIGFTDAKFNVVGNKVIINSMEIYEISLVDRPRQPLTDLTEVHHLAIGNLATKKDEEDLQGKANPSIQGSKALGNQKNPKAELNNKSVVKNKGFNEDNSKQLPENEQRNEQPTEGDVGATEDPEALADVEEGEETLPEGEGEELLPDGEEELPKEEEGEVIKEGNDIVDEETLSEGEEALKMLQDGTGNISKAIEIMEIESNKEGYDAFKKDTIGKIAELNAKLMDIITDTMAHEKKEIKTKSESKPEMKPEGEENKNQKFVEKLGKGFGAFALALKDMDTATREMCKEQNLAYTSGIADSFSIGAAVTDEIAKEDGQVHSGGKMSGGMGVGSDIKMTSTQYETIINTLLENDKITKKQISDMQLSINSLAANRTQGAGAAAFKEFSSTDVSGKPAERYNALNDPNHQIYKQKQIVGV